MANQRRPVSGIERPILLRPSGPVRTAVAALLLLALAAIGFSVAALQALSGGRAYVNGEGLWSKAQQEAVFYLDRYAEAGAPRDLLRARRALRIPLGDRQARLALQGSAYDYEQAYAGFLAGGNHPDDIPTMIALFEYFERAPYFREAIAVWRQADPHILDLQALARRLEREWGTENPSPDAIARMRAELGDIDDRLRILENRFSLTLGIGLRTLTTVLAALTAVLLLAFAGSAAVALRRATRRIRASERRFWTSFEHAPVGMALLSADGALVEVNDALCRILNASRQELLRSSIDDLLHRDDRDEATQRLDEVRSRARASVSLEQRFVRRDGVSLWGKLTLSASPGSAGGDHALIAVLEDVSEAHELSEQLSYEAHHDPLTGLINRRTFERRVDALIADARHKGTRHTLGFVDLDQFKQVNDTCGHAAGDALLEQIAQVMNRQLRNSDILGRVGGDEFGLLLHNCPVDHGTEVVDKLRQAVDGFAFSWEGRGFALSASTGLVELSGDFADAVSAMQAADSACYVAKQAGRDSIQVGTRADAASRAMPAQNGWHERLAHAIEQNRLALHAQRIRPLAGADELRYEILVRLNEGDQQFLPGAFLPAAERHRMGPALDQHVLLRLYTALRARPAHLDALTACHVNVSDQSLADPGFLELLDQLAGDEIVPAGRICLEINETATIARPADAQRFLERASGRGFRLAIDDFGRGLSAAGFLRSLPVDAIKINGAFVRDIAEDAVSLALVRSIAEIARVLGKHSIAESVEQQSVRDSVHDIGIDYAQGCAIHEPEPIEALMGEAARVRTG